MRRRRRRGVETEKEGTERRGKREKKGDKVREKKWTVHDRKREVDIKGKAEDIAGHGQ